MKIVDYKNIVILLKNNIIESSFEKKKLYTFLSKRKKKTISQICKYFDNDALQSIGKFIVKNVVNYCIYIYKWFVYIGIK